MIEDLIGKAFGGLYIENKLSFLKSNGVYYTYKTEYIEEPLLHLKY